MTKGKERSIFYKVKKAVALLLGILTLATFQAAPQEVQKPKYDYMSTFLSRSTQPLGLKEDPTIKKLLGQGAVKWAIRAGSRHLLD